MATNYALPDINNETANSDFPSLPTISGENRQRPKSLEVDSPKTLEVSEKLSPEEQKEYDTLFGHAVGDAESQQLPQTQRKVGTPSAQERLERESQDRSKEPEPTWEETGKGALQQLLPSSGRLIKETAKALTVNLPETAEGIGQIISGLSSKVGGAFGLQQSPEEKQKKEALVNALGRHYAETYGSVEGFKKALAKDPASILADLSLPFSGGVGILAKGTGALAKTAKVGSLTAKAGSLAEKALALTAKGAQYLDPTQAALGVAGKVAKAPTAVLRGLSATRSGVPYSSLTDIYNLAKQGNQVQKEAFDLGRIGTESAVFDRVHDSFDVASQKASAAYVAGKGNLANKTADWQSIAYKVEQEIDDLVFPNKKGMSNPTINDVPVGNHDAFKALKTAENDLQGYLGGNISDADHFKRSLYNNIYGTFGANSSAGKSLNRVAGEIKKSIGAIDPNYLQIMDQWQDWLNLSNELKSAGAAGSKAGDTAALERLMKALKKPAKRENTIDVLTKHDEGIPYLLAGYATKPMFRGVPNIMDLALGGLGTYMFTHPAGAVGAAYAISPRAGSMTQTALGTLDKYGSAATSKPITYTAEQLRPGEEGAFPEASVAPSAEGEASAALSAEGEASAALSSEPRNARNNNPGNIKDGSFAKNLPGYKGSDGTFAIFETPEAGSNALENLLGSYINRGYNTVSKIIERYAPVGAENSAESSSNYIKTVAKKLGVDPNQEIDLNVIKNLARAISGFEGKEIAATEDRIGRASGGRAVNHADMAEKLVRQAERVKKVQGQGTEALLDHQDDAIISALEIANRHI